MIDLHLHLDGSLSQKDFEYLSKVKNIRLGEDFPNSIHVSDDCKSLEEYLEKFDLPLKFMQDEDSLEYLTESLVKRLSDLGYIYAEIRYAPLLHLQNGLTMDQVVKSTIKGLKNGLSKCKDFDANLILCCMRHADESLNLETVELANKYKNDKVVGVDLAGAESLHPSPYYSKVFNKAQEYGLNITIHAGESTDSKEIMDAIKNGATRIGHGVHFAFDEESINIIKNKDIMFEVCPTSNLQTKSLLKYSDVPLMKFLENDIAVCINSDNMTVSNITEIEDMKHMIKTFNLSKEQVYKLYENSINHSFTSKENKEKLLNLLSSKFDNFYQSL